jgi:hypothetical protein
VTGARFPDHDVGDASRLDGGQDPPHRFVRRHDLNSEWLDLGTPPDPVPRPVGRLRGVEHLEQDVVLPSANDAHVLRREAVPHEAVTPKDHL